MWFVLLAVLAWGWFWNAEFAAEGAQLQTAWTIVDEDAAAAAAEYRTDVVLRYPKGANVELVRATDNERVRLRADDDLTCSQEGIEILATFRIRPKGRTDAEKVGVALVVGGNTVLAKEEGKLRERLSLSAFVDTDRPPTCA